MTHVAAAMAGALLAHMQQRILILECLLLEFCTGHVGGVAHSRKGRAALGRDERGIVEAHRRRRPAARERHCARRQLATPTRNGRPEARPHLCCVVHVEPLPHTLKFRRVVGDVHETTKVDRIMRYVVVTHAVGNALRIRRWHVGSVARCCRVGVDCRMRGAAEGTADEHVHLVHRDARIAHRAQQVQTRRGVADIGVDGDMERLAAGGRRRTSASRERLVVRSAFCQVGVRIARRGVAVGVRIARRGGVAVR
mmetsp:Transcript_5477/g.16126  ORF Transcript_5477/g.16126 Transcript_5477/m.16126 type:complete len:253 (-) Transcript_5477:670-1428(-)